MLQKLITHFRYSKFKYYPELSSLDSGLVCLKMAVDFYGKNYSMEYLQEKSAHINFPMTLQDIVDVGDEIDFIGCHMEILYHQLIDQMIPPVIIGWEEDDYVMFYGTQKNFWSFLPWIKTERKVIIVNPKEGFRIIDEATFMNHWRQPPNKRTGAIVRILSGFTRLKAKPQD